MLFPLYDENPTKIIPYVTIGVIALCVLIFIYQFTLEGYGFNYFVETWGFTPGEFFGHSPVEPVAEQVSPRVTLFSSMFLHGGWMHLISNMLYMWIFANNIEDSMGHVKFVIFYLACGVIAAMSQAAPDAQSVIPMIGASGAVSGILGAYLLLYPMAKVKVLIPLGVFTRLMDLKAIWVLGFWFVYQVFASWAASAQAAECNPELQSCGGGVAYGAHIGGFIAGMVLIPFFKYSHIKLQNPLDILKNLKNRI